MNQRVNRLISLYNYISTKNGQKQQIFVVLNDIAYLPALYLLKSYAKYPFCNQLIVQKNRHLIKLAIVFSLFG